MAKFSPPEKKDKKRNFRAAHPNISSFAINVMQPFNPPPPSLLFSFWLTPSPALGDNIYKQQRGQFFFKKNLPKKGKGPIFSLFSKIASSSWFTFFPYHF